MFNEMKGYYFFKLGHPAFSRFSVILQPSRFLCQSIQLTLYQEKYSSSICQQVRSGHFFNICVGIYSCIRVREISFKEIANNRGGYQKLTGQLLLNLSPISHSDLFTQNNCDPFHHSNYQQRVEHFTSILSSCVPLGITQTLRILNNPPGGPANIPESTRSNTEDEC